MHFAYEDRTFYWYVQLIGPADQSDKYRFEIDIQDNNGGNCRLYFREKCGMLTEKEKLTEINCHAFLHYDQVKYLVSSQVTFEIRVLEL